MIAEDIAQHFKDQRNEHLPHAKNIRRYLRKPVLAITRRVLLPRMDYDNDAIMQRIGNEQFGEETNVDPTFAKGKEGLDWRDYLTTEPSWPKDIDTDLSFSETETETEGEQMRINSRTRAQLKNMNALPQPSMKTLPNAGNAKKMKLTRRTLARMEAFLASTAYALPNDAVSAERKVPIKNVVPSLKSLTTSLPSSIATKFRTNKATEKNSHASSENNNNIGNGNNKGEKSSSPTKKKKNTTRSYPQMRLNDLTLRLELYIRTLRRMRAHLLKNDANSNAFTTSSSNESHDQQPAPIEADECVIHLEPAKAMKTRIDLIIDSLVSTVGSVGSMRHILNNLLVHFSREMLAVELISEDIQSYIRKIVLDYEHQTSFASLAFLSTPEDSAETQLAPLLANYVEYLQKEWKRCVWESRLESTLARAIDPAVRKMFKTVEFVSIGHLLDVCREYKSALENITISSKDFDGANPSSGFSILSPKSIPMELSAQSVSNNKAVKQALRDLSRETIIINGQILPPVQSLKELVKVLEERINSRPMRLKEKKLNQHGRKGKSKLDEAEKSSIDSGSGSSSESHTSESDGEVTSGHEADEDDSPNKYDIRRKPSSEDSSNGSLASTKSGGKKKQLVDTIDIMTRRLLLAASRTRGGGDAFFVVADLFGGEGVQVVPSRVQTHRGPYHAGNISPTIELRVRLASITIKCHSVFDVYPDNVDECEPFIRLRTTTTETIELQEVRIDDHGLELEAPEQDGKSSRMKATKVMLKEKAGDNGGRRVLTITPAKYERVDNWHTPS